MLKNRTRGMTQRATYWAPGPNDAKGTPTLQTPIYLSCRWEDKQKLIVGIEGKQITSQAVVYVEQPVQVQGYLALGELPIDTPPKTSGKRIEAIGSDPNFRGTEVLNSAWV